MRGSSRIEGDHASLIMDYRNAVVQIYLLFDSGIRSTSLYPLAAGVRLDEQVCLEQPRSPAGPNDQMPALRNVRYPTKRHRCVGRRVLFPELRAVGEQGLTGTEFSSGIKILHHS